MIESRYATVRRFTESGVTYLVRLAPCEQRWGVCRYMDALVFETDFQIWSVPIYKPFRLEWLSRHELGTLLGRAKMEGRTDTGTGSG